VYLISIVFILILILIAGNVWETPHLDSKIVPRMRYGHSAVLFGVSNCVARVKTNLQNRQKNNKKRLPTIVDIPLLIEGMTNPKMAKMMMERTRPS
jgi:hypothetical protein